MDVIRGCKRLITSRNERLVVRRDRSRMERQSEKIYGLFNGKESTLQSAMSIIKKSVRQSLITKRLITFIKRINARIFYS